MSQVLSQVLLFGNPFFEVAVPIPPLKSMEYGTFLKKVCGILEETGAFSVISSTGEGSALAAIEAEIYVLERAVEVESDTDPEVAALYNNSFRPRLETLQAKARRVKALAEIYRTYKAGGPLCVGAMHDLYGELFKTDSLYCGYKAKAVEFVGLQ